MTNNLTIKQWSLPFIGFLAFCQLAHGQNFILNGDFESPALSPDSLGVGATDWSASGNFYRVNGVGNNSLYYPGPAEGVQYAYLDSHGVASQSFAISSAGTYQLVWWESPAQPGFGDGAPYTVALVDALSAVVASGNYGSLDGQGWASHSMLTSLSPGSYTLSFENTGTTAPLFFDGVTLSAVPEPSEWAAVAGTALIGFAVWRRRSRQ